MPPKIELSFDGWNAIRRDQVPCPGWYFHNTKTNKAQNEGPPGIFPESTNLSDPLEMAKILDEKYLSSNPTAVLSPLATKEERLYLRYAEQYSREYKMHPSIVVSQPENDIAPLQNSIWSKCVPQHFSNESVQKQISKSLTISVLEPVSGSSLNASWDSTVRGILEHIDASKDEKFLRTLLEKNSEVLNVPGVPTAISELLASRSKPFSSDMSTLLSITSSISKPSLDVQNLALNSAVLSFSSKYNPAAGESAIQSKDLSGLENIIKSLSTNSTLMNAILNLSNKDVHDEFMKTLVRFASEQPASMMKMTNAIVLSGNMDFYSELASHSARELIRISEIVSSSSTLFPVTHPATSTTLSPIMQQELPAFIMLIVLEHVSRHLVNTYMPNFIRGVSIPPKSNTNSSSDTYSTWSSQTSEKFEYPLLAIGTAVRLARVRQEWGYLLMTRDGCLSPSLSVLPADPVALIAASAAADASEAASGGDGEKQEGLVDIYDVARDLRLVTGKFFQIHRASLEFCPHPDSVMLETVPEMFQPPSTLPPPPRRPPTDQEILAEGTDGADESKVANEQLYQRIKSSLCSLALASGEVRTAVVAIRALKRFFYSTRDFEQMQAQQQQFSMEAADLELKYRALLQQAVDPQEQQQEQLEQLQQAWVEAAQSALSLEQAILARAFVARTLLQADVICTLVHLLYHPTGGVAAWACDTAASAGANSPAVEETVGAAEFIAAALAWVISLRQEPQSNHAFTSLRSNFQVFEGAQQAADKTAWTQPLDFFNSTSNVLPDVLLRATETSPDQTLTEVALAQLLLETHQTLCYNGRIYSLRRQLQDNSPSPAFVGNSLLPVVNPVIQQLQHLETSVLRAALTHPVLALGWLHYARHCLVQPTELVDVRSCQVFVTSAPLLSQRHLFLGPNLLLLLRQTMLYFPPAEMADSRYNNLRRSIFDALSDLLFLSGLELQILNFLTALVPSLEMTPLKRFFNALLQALAPNDSQFGGNISPAGIDFAYAVCQFIYALQSKAAKISDNVINENFTTIHSILSVFAESTAKWTSQNPDLDKFPSHKVTNLLILIDHISRAR